MRVRGGEGVSDCARARALCWRARGGTEHRCACAARVFYIRDTFILYNTTTTTIITTTTYYYYYRHVTILSITIAILSIILSITINLTGTLTVTLQCYWCYSYGCSIKHDDASQHLRRVYV